MSQSLHNRLQYTREGIDRPRSFCARGSFPAILVGLTGKNVGPVVTLHTGQRAKEGKKHDERAPSGKGEESRVETIVRRVGYSTPDPILLTHPFWKPLVRERGSEGLIQMGRQRRKSHLP